MTRLALLLLVPGCVYEVTTEDRSFQVQQPFDHLVLHADSGDVSVHPTDGTPRVDLHLRYHGDAPDLEWGVRDGVLTVDVRCRQVLAPCSADVAASVPADTSAEVDTGSGDVTVHGLSGDVSGDTGSGDITVSRLSGDLELSTGSGEVTGTELASTMLAADTGSGDVDLVFVEVPDDVDVETGSGDLSLLVPADTYSLDLHTGSGDTVIDGIGVDARSPHHLRAHTGSGDIAVQGFGDLPTQPGS